LAYHVFKTHTAQLAKSHDFVWLDGQSSHASSVARFCHAIANSLEIKCEVKLAPEDGLIQFEDMVKRHSKRLVLMLNEFEVFTAPDRRNEFRVSFFNTLRYLAEQGLCALVTTSHLSLKAVCKDVLEVSSPFYNIFEEIKVEEFSTSEADYFLNSVHDGIKLTATEIDFIRNCVPEYRHPLVLQISADTVFRNRKLKACHEDVCSRIGKKKSHFLSHTDVQKGRVMIEAKRSGQGISKSVDLAVSVLVPVLGLGLLMLEYGLLMQHLTVFQAIILALATALIGFGILLFAGRSIDIIGESTFYKLFLAVINKLPLLSNLAQAFLRNPKPGKRNE